MTANQTIYQIHANRRLSRLWRKLSVPARREAVKRLERAENAEIEAVLREVKTGQRELF